MNNEFHSAIIVLCRSIRTHICIHSYKIGILYLLYLSISYSRLTNVHRKYVGGWEEYSHVLTYTKTKKMKKLIKKHGIPSDLRHKVRYSHALTWEIHFYAFICTFALFIDNHTTLWAFFRCHHSTVLLNNIHSF